MNFSLAVQISFFRRAVFQTNDDGLFLYESMANELALTPGAFNFPYGPYKDMPPPPPGRDRAAARRPGLGPGRRLPHHAALVVETGMPYSVGSEHPGADGPVSYPG